MDPTPAQVLTIEEAAEFLRIPVSSMYRLAQLGKVPATKVGRHWRFYRPALVDWIARGSAAAAGSAGGDSSPAGPVTPEKV